MSGYNKQQIRLRLNHDIEPHFAVMPKDNGREFHFIFDDFILDSNISEARIYVLKPSGKEIYNECRIVESEVIVKSTTQMLAEPGKNIGAIQLIYSSNGLEKVTSFPFIMCVHKDVIDESSIESKDEFSILDSLINEARKLIIDVEEAESLRNSAEQERILNENERITAENDRKTAESIRNTNEIVRQTAESNRVNAENARVNAENLRDFAEQERDNAENLRIIQEETRNGAEDLRKSAENTRVIQETNRVNSENKRQTDTAEAISMSNAATERANNAAENAEKATEAANNAASDANTAAETANEAAENANNNASVANSAAGVANTAADRAEKAADRAEELILGDISEKTITFEMASERAGVNSGDSLAVAFGKLAKYCADLKTHAFANPVNNLLGTNPELPLASTQGKALNDAKMDKTGNASNVTNTFTQATARNQLTSGEKLSVSLGKIMKFLADLKSGAYSTVVNNLTTTAAGYALDARQGKALNDKYASLNSAFIGKFYLVNEELRYTDDGQESYADYTPPSGYVAISAQLINAPNGYFGVKLVKLASTGNRITVCLNWGYSGNWGTRIYLMKI